MKKDSFYFISKKIKENKKNVNSLYKENKDTIHKYCYIFSEYFNLEYQDLESESDRIFLFCIHKYYHNQFSFNTYFRNQLITYLKHFCYEQLRDREYEREAKQKIKNQLFFIDTEIKIKNKMILNLSDDVRKIMTDIIDFCLQPNFMDLLAPYIKITKQKKQKPSAYIIKNYFNDVFGYSHHKLNKAIEGIKYILKEEMI